MGWFTNQQPPENTSGHAGKAELLKGQAKFFGKLFAVFLFQIDPFCIEPVFRLFQSYESINHGFYDEVKKH